jgi:hypothetical protein
VDADYRDSTEIAALLSHGIHTIFVAEIENIFCVEAALRIVAEHLGKDADDVVSEVTRYVSSALNREIELQISSMAEKRIQYLLNAFSKTSNDISGLSEGLKVTLDRIDVTAIYDQCRNDFDTALRSGSLDELLRVYNRKSLANRISGILGLANGEYAKLLVRLMKGPNQQRIVAALKKYIPTLP